MTTQWLLFGALMLILAGGLGALKLFERRKLKRLRGLACPECVDPFVVPAIPGERWAEVDIETTRVTDGFYLSCEKCGVTFRDNDQYEFLGRKNADSGEGSG